jgi:hypothetical protein|tara:strand:+ start:342 stop:548 length:207 start_codon:yes stop_codon:yes gene_type:complete
MNIPAVKEIKIKKNKGIIILFSKGHIPNLTFSELAIEKNITKKKNMINNNLEKSFINILFTLNYGLRN